MSETEVIRHQVTIYGTVFDRDGEPALAVPVWAEDSASAIRQNTTSRADGTYYFLDLPKGDYVVSASLHGASARQPATVVGNDKGDIALAEVNLKLAVAT